MVSEALAEAVVAGELSADGIGERQIVLEERCGGCIL
jgi:hypothetical protein